MTAKVRAADAWAALVSEMDESRPSCRGDQRFTLDRDQLIDGELDEMEATCWQCPIRDACLKFATTERPTGGYWAGQFWGRNETSKATRAAREGDTNG